MRFDAKTLKLMRAEALRTMMSALAKVSVAATSDGEGGYTESATSGTATVGRIHPIQASQAERLLGGGIEARQRYKLFAPYDFSAGAHDRVAVDGVTYEVEAALTPSSPDVILTMFVVYRVG